MPSHYITMEIYFVSHRSSLFHSKPVRFIKCFLSIKLVVFLFPSAYLVHVFPYVHVLLSSVSPALCRASHAFLLLHESSLASIFCISFPRMGLYLSYSFCQKKTLVILVCQTLRYFRLTFFSHTMLPFMGVVECSTTSPSFIN
jgi:hypothetical protein